GTLQRLTVIDGRILPPSGEASLLDTIEAELGRAEDRSLSGSVRAVWRDWPVTLAIDSGAFAAGRSTAVKLRLSLDDLATATFDGNVRPDPQAPQLDGAFAVETQELAGLHEPLAQLLGREPWQPGGMLGAATLGGRLGYEAGRWTLAEAALALG